MSGKMSKIDKRSNKRPIIVGVVGTLFVSFFILVGVGNGQLYDTEHRRVMDDVNECNEIYNEGNLVPELYGCVASKKLGSPAYLPISGLVMYGAYGFAILSAMITIFASIMVAGQKRS